MSAQYARRFPVPAELRHRLYDPDVERDLIGSVLLDPSLLTEPRINSLTDDDFQVADHRWIWNAVRRVIREGARGDNILIALTKLMEKPGGGWEAGGPAYLTKAVAYVTLPRRATGLANRVAEFSRKRKAVAKAQQIIAEVVADLTPEDDGGEE